MDRPRTTLRRAVPTIRPKLPQRSFQIVPNNIRPFSTNLLSNPLPSVDTVSSDAELATRLQNYIPSFGYAI